MLGHTFYAKQLNLEPRWGEPRWDERRREAGRPATGGLIGALLRLLRPAAP